VKNEIQYAGPWTRFLALLVDFLLFCACFFPATRIVKGVWLMSPNDHHWVHGWFVFDPLCLIFLVIMMLYMFSLEGWLGVTLGKWLLGLRVRRDRSRLGCPVVHALAPDEPATPARAEADFLSRYPDELPCGRPIHGSQY
jgi:uncharacterized RDD family membrane protein YckC